MLIANVCELDQLPFLKKPRFKWISEEQQEQRSKIRLLQNLRSISYQYSSIISKIFNCQKEIKKDTSAKQQINSQSNSISQQSSSIYQQLVITTQKQILSLQKFFYLINQLLPHQQFSHLVSNINKFVQKTKKFVKLIVQKSQIDFLNKQFLTFGIYFHKLNPNSLNFNQSSQSDILQKIIKNNRFLIKCSINNFNFLPLRDYSQSKIIKPQCFQIKNTAIIKKLFNIYLELSQIYLPIKPKDIKNYIQSFDAATHFVDEEYLKFQVFKNYPLLRSKFYMPIKFNDRITGQRLDGPIFSNSDPDCMFSHFIGYNADRIKDLQGNNCQQCRVYFQGVQQNPILTHLRDNPYNPYKADVLFCPQFNRFKLIIQTERNSQNIEQEQQQGPKVKKQIRYLNYLHMRSNLKKMYSKKRNKYNDMIQNEKFVLTFEIWKKRILIMDPARGKNCSHYEFTDLRCYYMNKTNDNNYKCPICNDIMSDNDIIYLKEVQIILKYLKYKCQKFKQLVITGQLYINHQENKVFLEYKRRNKENKQIIETDIIQIKNYYSTLVDPYITFNQYTLGMPSKYDKKLKDKYLFGFDTQNQAKDSDQDFQYKDIDIDNYQFQKPNKKNNQTQIISYK